MPTPEPREFTETDMHNARNAGFKDGQNHMQMSPETKNVIKDIEKSITDSRDQSIILKIDMDYLKGEVKEIKETIKEMPTKKDLTILGDNLSKGIMCDAEKRFTEKREFNDVKGQVRWLIGIVLFIGAGAIFIIWDIIKNHIFQ